MSQNHTPGPWEAEHGADSYFYVTHDDGLESRNVDADARLIAAAPDLLAALEKAAPFIGWASTRGQILAGVDAVDLCDEIDAAISKAKASSS